MSYAKGKFFLLLGVFLAIHILFGFFGYYRMIHFERNIRNLKNENKELKARNMRIEVIAKEFQKIRQTDEKIRRAFGGSLGLFETSGINRGIQNQAQNVPPAGSAPGILQSNPEKLSEGYYFLSKSNVTPDVPDNLPTLLPVEGFMTTHFQKRGLFNGRNHYGIDIAAQRGSAIYAAGSGVVLLADWTPNYGNMIILSHGQGVVSYYGHAMQLIVNQGDMVRKGQIIAWLGSSGISSAPHLHFEIWKDGKPVDPEQFLFSVQKRKDNSGL